MKRAKKYCERNKYRFTEPRERVLKLLTQQKKPLGAYEILELLSSNEKKLKPPTVYRAIEFWHKNGFIHRVESLNAYIACCESHYHEHFCVLICSECKKVNEFKTKEISSVLDNLKTDYHFSATRSVTEVYGKCATCC